jgi:hypothetical protein
MTQMQGLEDDVKTLSRDGLCFKVDLLDADAATWVIE